MISLFTSMFVWMAGSLLARVLVGAGLSVVTFSILSSLLDDALTFLTSNLGALGDAVQVLYIAGVGTGLSIIGSAMVARVAIDASSFTLKKV